MFRSRKNSSKTTTTAAAVIQTSSLSSGNASIVKKSPTLEVENYYNSEPSTPNYEVYNENEIIDLQATPSKNDLTIESMSAVIAAAVQMSSKGGAPSSLSLGSASILQPFSKTELVNENKKRRFSLFTGWNNNKNKLAPTSPTTTTSSPTTPGLEPSSPFDSTITTDDDNSSQGSPRSSSVSNLQDDGRDELAYRGIQVKEIKTTLKTLVISDQVRCPMPEVRLERPGFARINY